MKIGKFKPEHINQIFLEALDLDIKKQNEHPSVSVILCTGKNHAVVEYALSRRMSPTVFQPLPPQSPDKKLLQEQLKKLTDSALENGDVL